MTPTTLIEQGPMIFQHPVTHNGPAVVWLVVMAVLAGLAGGAICAVLVLTTRAARRAR